MYTICTYNCMYILTMVNWKPQLPLIPKWPVSGGVDLSRKYWMECILLIQTFGETEKNTGKIWAIQRQFFRVLEIVFDCRGTSLTTKRNPLRPDRRPMPSVRGGFSGGERFRKSEVPLHGGVEYTLKILNDCLSTGLPHLQGNAPT